MRISDWSSDVCSSDLPDASSLPPSRSAVAASIPPMLPLISRRTLTTNHAEASVTSCHRFEKQAEPAGQSPRLLSAQHILDRADRLQQVALGIGLDRKRVV